MRIDNSHDVVSGADSDSRAIYIDRRIPQFSPRLRSSAGRPLNLWKHLSTHESWEAHLMGKGFDYEAAHKEATAREKRGVEKDGCSWKEYEAEINGYLAHIEKEKATNPPPPDQHVRPHRALRRQGKR